MRIQLTENQFALVKRITESVDVSDKIINGIKDVRGAADKLYTIITFTTVAEFRDGDTDVGVLDKRVEQLSDKADKLGRMVSDFEERNMNYDGEWENPNLEKIYDDMNSAIWKLQPKIDALEQLISILKPLSKVDEYGEGREKDIHGPFSNITPTEI